MRYFFGGLNSERVKRSVFFRRRGNRALLRTVPAGLVLARIIAGCDIQEWCVVNC